jgi:hypothetical protein
MLILLLLGCVESVSRDNFPIQAGTTICDKRECDKGKSILLSSGEDCYKEVQMAYTHFLYIQEHGPFMDCTFDESVATEFVDGYKDLDCQAFYLGETPPLSAPLYDCTQ